MKIITDIINTFTTSTTNNNNSQNQIKINSSIIQQPENFDCYTRKIKTDQNNEMTLIIKKINSQLSIKCSYEKNYFTKIFSNSFTLENLYQLCKYFRMFESIDEVLKEILGNKYKGKESIEGNEEKSKIIKLIIPLPSTNYQSVTFPLDEEIKSPFDINKEKDFIIKRYEYEKNIANFESKILIGKDLEKQTIKSWIAPNKRLSCELLYSYHSICYIDDKNKEIFFNPGNDETVGNFHKDCDNKKRILMICKSNNEIFGGYTPLSFNSSGKYGCDIDSFLFSVNKFKKYSKNPLKNNESIKCHKNYGPCFYDDLFFQENKMNKVIFDRSNYLTCDNWIDKTNCIISGKAVVLDSLEIFQIKEEEYNYEALKASLNNNINDNTNEFITIDGNINTRFINNNDSNNNIIQNNFYKNNNIIINNINNFTIRSDENNINNEKIEFPINIPRNQNGKNNLINSKEKVKKKKIEEKNKIENKILEKIEDKKQKSNISKMSESGNINILAEEMKKGNNSEQSSLVKDFQNIYDKKVNNNIDNE